MLNGLYLLFIAPLEFLMRLVLEWGFSLTHSWGWSLVLLSLAVNTAILPLYNWAERGQEEERRLRRAMSRHEAMIRRIFRGQKRFALLTTLRRQRGLGYGLTLRATLGLLVQIPFFIAAFHLLSTWQPFQGQSFGPLADLGAPDALLALGSVTVNLLPLLMTAVNLASAFVYAADLTRRDKTQMYGMAVLFLVLLYTAPSALVLYWTLNNVYSLGKNFVEKSLPRRALRRGAPNRCHRRERPAVAGTLAHHAGRALNITAISCAVGAVFWLAVCTAALLQRHNLLDSEFRSAMWHFAGQTLLSAFLASLVVFSILPRSSSRRESGPHLFLVCVSIPVLFLLQVKLFKSGLTVEQGHFLFDMWNGTGTFCFVLWTAGVFCLTRCWKYFAPLLNNRLDQAIHTCTAHISAKESARIDEAVTRLPLHRDTFLLACIMGAGGALFLWLFLPLNTYFHNVNEFVFDAWELAAALPSYFLGTMLLLVVLFWGAAHCLPWECVPLPWRPRAKTGGKVTLAHTLAAMFGLGILLEGTILSYQLPQLTGETHLFDSILRLCVDTALWLNVVIVGIKYWRRLAKKLHIVLGLLALFSLTTLADAYRSKTDKIEPEAYKESVNGLYVVDEFTLFSHFCFSRKENTIVILVDSLDTLAFEKTLELYPELHSIFDGFWLFRENLGAGGHTVTAMPQIFLGKTYDGTISFKEFTESSIRGPQSISANAVKNGRRVFIDFFWPTMSSDSEIYIDYSHRKIEMKDYINLLYFRFLPYLGKMIFEDTANFKDKRLDKYLAVDEDLNTKKFNKVIDRMTNLCDEPVFQFIYFFGVHPPFIKEDVFKTTYAFIQGFSRFAAALKTMDLYEKTTIVLMADHGLQNKKYDHRYLYPERNGKYPTIYFPLFMIKTASSTDAMVVREELMSSIYLKDILESFYKHGSSNKVLESYLADLPQVRYMYLPEMGRLQATGTFNTMSIKKIESFAKP